VVVDIPYEASVFGIMIIDKKCVEENVPGYFVVRKGVSTSLDMPYL